MAMVQVGVIALRTPDGNFLPATPLYKEIPDENINKETGMTHAEESAYSDLATMLAKKFKQYKDGCKNIGEEDNKNDVQDV